MHNDCCLGIIVFIIVCVQLEPPLEPPRGEVNAADAFDIGNFDEDDTKKIRVGLLSKQICLAHSRYTTTQFL